MTILEPGDGDRPAGASSASESDFVLDDTILSSILDHMPNGVACCRMLFESGKPHDFVYLYTNSSFHEQTGLGPVVGKRVSEVIDGIQDSDPQLFEIYGRVATGGPPEKFELFVASLKEWFSVQVFSPRPLHFIAAFDVVTESKNRELALLRTQERLALAQIAARSGVWDWDLVTEGIVWSAEFFDLFGLDPEKVEASFNTWRHVVHPEDLKTAETRIYESIRDHSLLYNEYRIILPAGETRWIAAHGNTTYDTDGHALRMIGICIDISERKRLEEERLQLEMQLRESQKMEAIGTLAGGIAHDFNNLIATILGNAKLAHDDAADDPLATRGSIEEIRKAGSRARDLVRQILSFSSRQTHAIAVIQLLPAIEETLRMLRAMIPPRISLAVHCNSNLPAVLADTSQIEQVVLNLVTNAFHAMPGNGRIEIRLDTVMLDAELAHTDAQLRAMHERNPGLTVRVAVSDTGSGMDAAVLKRIFEPFFTTKPVGEGTGLGLSVVYGIVQSHGGAITVDSTPGRGTTFTLYLKTAPVGAGASADAAAATAAFPKLRREGEAHILYLDDDEALVSLVTRLLKRSGYRVSGFGSPSVALSALKASPASFDLVITDFNMPEMSGLDVAREVKSIRTDVPVVIVSGFIDDDLLSRATAIGVQEVVFKATEVEEMTAVISRLVQVAGANGSSAS